MQCTAARFVIRSLSYDLKAHCIAVCSELEKQNENNLKIIFDIITGDESWV
jgi:hypothetical protein